MPIRPVDYVTFRVGDGITILLDQRLTNCKGDAFLVAVELAATLCLEQWAALQGEDPRIERIVPLMAAGLRKLSAEINGADAEPPIGKGLDFCIAMRPLLRRAPGDSNEEMELCGFLTPIAIGDCTRMRRFPLAVELQLLPECSFGVQALVRLMSKLEKHRFEKHCKI